MTLEFGNIPESCALDKRDASFLAEIVFAYLACTIGPQSSRGSHLWTAKNRDTLARIFRRAYLHPSVAGAAMHLIGRLKRKQPDLEVNGKAGLNMYIAALIIADKLVHDRHLRRKSWPGILSDALTLTQLSKLELMFLEAIDWNTRLECVMFDNFQGMFHGWRYIREHSNNVDFFLNRRWDNIRPTAFDDFDGVESSDGVRHDFWPVNGEADDVWGDPVYYDLETSVWEDIPVSDRALSKVGRGVRPASFPAKPRSKVTHALPSQLNLREAASPPRLAAASSRSPTANESREAAALLKPASITSVEPTEDGIFTRDTYRSPETIDDLTTVDWNAVKQPLTNKDRKVLRVGGNRPLMRFGLERVGRFNREERIERYMSRLPANPAEFDQMDDPELYLDAPFSEHSVEPKETGQEGSSSSSEGTLDDLPVVDWDAEEPELTEEDKGILGLEYTPPGPHLFKFHINALSILSTYEKGQSKQANIAKWVSRTPVNPADFVVMQMARTISSVYA